MITIVPMPTAPRPNPAVAVIPIPTTVPTPNVRNPATADAAIATVPTADPTAPDKSFADAAPPTILAFFFLHFLSLKISESYSAILK